MWNRKKNRIADLEASLLSARMREERQRDDMSRVCAQRDEALRQVHALAEAVGGAGTYRVYEEKVRPVRVTLTKTHDHDIREHEVPVVEITIAEYEDGYFVSRYVGPS